MRGTGRPHGLTPMVQQLAQLERDIATIQATHLQLVADGHSSDAALYEDMLIYLVDERNDLISQIRIQNRSR